MQIICSVLRRTAFFIFLFCLGAGTSQAGNQLYFGALAVQNQVTSNMMVLLEWGPLEGKIPLEFTAFKIYRREGAGNYTELAQVPNDLVGATALKAFFDEAGEGDQKQDIITWLAGTYPDDNPNESNFHTILHAILDPLSSRYDGMQRQFLSRYSRNVARGLGLAYLDKTIGTGSYTYMLSALSGSTETGPLGRVSVDTTTETLLPVPADFRQVLVSGCTAMRRQIDHGRVHLNWTVPATAADMPLRILIHGYDIYRADKPETGSCATVDLRSVIPSELVKVNETPVIVSGNTLPEGPDNYLAIDEGDFLAGGRALEAGNTFCYYLAARDLAGGYSATAGPLVVTVPDMAGPVMPWNIEARQEMVEDSTSGQIVPRLTLVWDQVNNLNYLNAYGDEKNICGSSPQKVCYVAPAESCRSDRPLCVDLDVSQYLVFRFDTFEEASKWGGADGDQDLWPDEVEAEAGSDPCDPNSHPSGILCDQSSWPPCDPSVYLPYELAARIPQDDPVHVRLLDTGKKLMAFRDPFPQPNNYVFWYRVAARDAGGNLSIPSPPIRAVLWDRSQPDVTNATLEVYHCDYRAIFEAESGCTSDPDPGVLSIIDHTGQAAGFAVFEQCNDGTTDYLKPVYSGDLTGGQRELRNSNPGDELYDYCNPVTEPCGPFVVRFYAADGSLLAELAPQSWGSLCASRVGCVILDRNCDYVEVGTGNTGYGVVHNPFMPVKICIPLAEDQSARVYQEINGVMSAIATARTQTAQTICIQPDIKTIVSAASCLAVRVFSRNHVGSAMFYFPCITVANVKSGPPSAPLIEKIIQNTDANDPTFTITWGGQRQGISAFILSGEAGGGPTLDTIWDPQPDSGTQQFSRIFAITSQDLNKKWCFRVRALNKALQASPWSEKQCKTWQQAASETYLKWPHISEIPEGESIAAVSPPPAGVTCTAFVLNAETLPAIVLSKDLTPYLNGLLSSPDGCEHYIGACWGTAPCSSAFTGPWTASRFFCQVCGLVRSWNRVGDFVVYRQVENRDFVQVSPLVDDIYCHGLGSVDVEDPLISLVRLEEDNGAHAVGGGVTTADDTDLQTNLEGTVRMLFFDYYPVAAGSRIRYKIIQTGRNSREPEQIFTSNWILMPTLP